MHTIVDYSKLSPIEKHNKAIQDLKDYLGERKFDELTQEFQKLSRDQMPLNQFTNYCGLAGISGYPVKAWYNYVYPL